MAADGANSNEAEDCDEGKHAYSECGGVPCYYHLDSGNAPTASKHRRRESLGMEVSLFTQRNLTTSLPHSGLVK